MGRTVFVHLCISDNALWLLHLIHFNLIYIIFFETQGLGRCFTLSVTVCNNVYLFVYNKYYIKSPHWIIKTKIVKKSALHFKLNVSVESKIKNSNIMFQVS